MTRASSNGTIFLAGLWHGVDTVLRWWSLRPRWMRALGPVAVMLLLWWSSSRSPRAGTAVAGVAFLLNGAHVVAYAGLATTVWLWDWCHEPSRSSRAAAVAFAVACGYGIVDELHQWHVPGRTASVSDWVTDCCGASLAATWLRWRLGGEARCRAWIPWLALACLASVALATWGPW